MLQRIPEGCYDPHRKMVGIQLRLGWGTCCSVDSILAKSPRPCSQGVHALLSPEYFARSLREVIEFQSESVVFPHMLLLKEELRKVGFKQYHFPILCFPPSALAGCKDLWILKTSALPLTGLICIFLLFHHSSLFCEGLGVQRL